MKRKKFGPVLPVLLLALAVILCLSLLPRIDRQIKEESRDAIRDAVLRSAMECYAVEGVYPGSLEHLEQHYGLRLNHRDFIVSYEVFASNQPPSVQVMLKGEG